MESWRQQGEYVCYFCSVFLCFFSFLLSFYLISTEVFGSKHCFQIRVNCVNPGLLMTNLTEKFRGSDFDRGYLERTSLEGYVGKCVLTGIYVMQYHSHHRLMNVHMTARVKKTNQQTTHEQTNHPANLPTLSPETNKQTNSRKQTNKQINKRTKPTKQTSKAIKSHMEARQPSFVGFQLSFLVLNNAPLPVRRMTNLACASVT